MNRSASMSAIVVGGSLAGLTTALALTRIGWQVHVLERSGPKPRTGGALQTSFQELARAIGRDHAETVIDAIGGEASGAPTFWSPLREGLRGAVHRDPLATLHHETQVTALQDEGDSASVTCSDGRTWRADAVIGADGHRSIVRESVAPEHPDATYAGYSLWIGLTRQSDIPQAQPARSQFFMRHGGPHLLLSYPRPSDGGDMLIGWAWYDATRNSLFRKEGSIAGSVVQRTLRAENVPPCVLKELAGEARKYWESPFSDAIAESARRREITGIPIAEYVPERIARGRLAIVGNAAHVPTPMTGSGFAASVDDAVALSHALRGSSPATVPDALETYQKARLDKAQALVESGRGFSRSFAIEQ
ncbi:monooxygenase [Arthrobacter sp. JZ12]|uniref:FAD-dependent monooxygenase n=1 Tax=Arthrobacter sp. JZ12 TaxID=2654190 RepID=UPI002B466471|nr:FAD-dependent monooxygenase [Arthrobacter sp. JZ12]WRH25324.1 monooxygenase [Arthrobacter sp. JZ12]